MSIIAQKLISAREEANLTQEELANLLGITQEAYGAYERKRTLPSVDRLMDISQRLGKPVTFFLGIESPTTNEDEILAVFRQLTKEQQKYALDSLRGLTGQKQIVITPVSPRPPQEQEIVIPDRDEETVPDPEEIIPLLKMLDETERYFVYDYIIWRLVEMQHRRNSSGRKRTEQERKKEHSEAIDVINLILAIEEADPQRIEEVISWLQKEKSRKEEPAQTTEPALSGEK